MAELKMVEGNIVVDLAAEYLFEHGRGNHGTEEVPRVFADLSSKEKLNLVKEHRDEVIVNLANTHKSTVAQKTVRDAEEASKHTAKLVVEL